MLSASPARLPLMRSTTRRAFTGATRTHRACALASIAVPPSFSYLKTSLSTSAALAATALAGVLIVAAECPRGCEFAELVPDHRLGDEHRNVLAAVMHRESVTEEVRGNYRPAGPGLNDVLSPLLVLNIQ